MEIKTGDIIFFKTKWCWYKPSSYLSTAIRIVANIEYNHVGVIILIWDMPFVIEAVGKGIVAVPYEKRVKGKSIKIVRPYRTIEEKEYATEAVSYLSTKYDIVGLLIHQLVYAITGKWIGAGKEREKKKLYCYEYVALLNSEDCPEWHKVIPKEFLQANWHYTLLMQN